MAKRIIIAGGGTGGHIFPAIAIANALKKIDPAIEILFVGAKGKMEMEKVPQAGYSIEGLDIAGYDRSSLIKNFSLPFKLVKSFFQVRRIISDFRPDAVIGVGGYSSFPVLRLAQARSIPSFIHESNSFAGRSNQMLGRNATRIFVATDGMEKFFPPSKIEITGNPVRPSIMQVGNINRTEALKFFELEGGRKTLLVVGGSLGARSINQAIAKGMERILSAGFQVIWQTGKNEAGKWKALAGKNKAVWVNEFITQMEQGYAAADMVVSRAGAMAIAELCLVKKPVIFVPFPFAAEDHQTVNAMNLVQKNAALMVADSEAGTKLVDAILALAGNEEEQKEFSRNISSCAVYDADRKVAERVLELINK
jgi:UDP-N-acetylglucosamine--N-acetylmuramyl-(pentapeptide) pyrophosphoryl-undecaprenol N-acetylglucosamine transferase